MTAQPVNQDPYRTFEMGIPGIPGHLCEQSACQDCGKEGKAAWFSKLWPSLEG